LELTEGIGFLAQSIDNKEDFKAFAYKAARLMDRAELAELFASIGKLEKFTPVWLKEIQGSCYKAPPEPAVVKEILTAHKLLYMPNVGFYEYMPQGKWALISDEIIHGYISETLGVFTAGGKLEPIKKLMKPEILTTQEFDRKPVVNFINGTLELETGVFRDHSQDDYCAIQLPYPFLPDAKCPRWDKFIDEVTAEDAKRQENLQFIAGYALFNDCRHERIFLLTGDGGNGKSIFTKIIQEVFGPENITHITPQGINEAFERIHLRASLLNIAGEIKNDLSNTEELLKQIASGESIQACYKGKDFIHFKPRAKMIFCCNGQPRSSDTSDGLSRRLTIIDFPCKFVEFPEKGDPYQREIDVMLYDKLLEELPGIFNWAYQGYKDLLYFGNFTETEEQKHLMKAFRQASNPIECFIDDMMDAPPDKISRESLYRQYVIWCEDNGHRALSSTRFNPEFKRLTKKTYRDYCVAVKKDDGTRTTQRGYEKIC